MGIQVKDLQQEQNKLAMQIKQLQEQSHAISVLIGALGGTASKTTSTTQLKTSVSKKAPLKKRNFALKCTRLPKGVHPVNFTPERMKIDTKVVNFNRISMTEILWRMHPELPVKFTVTELTEAIYKKMGSPHGKQKAMTSIRSNAQTTMFKTPFLHKMYSWDVPVGAANSRARVYTKKLVSLDAIRDMANEVGGVKHE